MRIGFVLREAVVGLRRNLPLAVAMGLTTALTLLMLGTGVMVLRMAERTSERMLGDTEVQVFLTPEVSLADPGCAAAPCRDAASALESAPGVSAVRYLDARGSVALFKDMYAGSELARNTSDEAPFPALFVVRFSDAGAGLDGLQNAIADVNTRAGMPVLQDPIDTREGVGALFGLLGGIRNGAFVLALLHGVAAVLLIGTMVQMAAGARSRELSIMRMVGARRWAIQVPFLLEILLAALVGAVAAAGGMVVVHEVISRALASRALEAGPSIISVSSVAGLDRGEVGLIAALVSGLGLLAAGVTAWVGVRLTVRR